MSTIIGIDPGPEMSAIVIYCPGSTKPALARHEPNTEIESILERCAYLSTHPVFEWPASYGLPVGGSIFQTCRWIGRFERTFARYGTFVTRPDIVRHFCKCTHYKDPDTGKRKPVTKANVKAALYERFGGDRRAAVGIKKKPGPLYGMKGDHVFDALACAVWYAETREQQP